MTYIGSPAISPPLQHLLLQKGCQNAEESLCLSFRHGEAELTYPPNLQGYLHAVASSNRKPLTLLGLCLTATQKHPSKSWRPNKIDVVPHSEIDTTRRAGKEERVNLSRAPVKSQTVFSVI